MIDITGLREDKRPQSSAIVHALLDRLEAAEKERDDLKAKIAEMEKQDPVTWHVWGKVAVGSMAAYSIPLYALPGAKGE